MAKFHKPYIDHILKMPVATITLVILLYSLTSLVSSFHHFHGKYDSFPFL